MGEHDDIGWWVDDPIQTLDSDSLDRGAFVERVRELVNHIGESPASTVVGLVGPWGSGKTSTVNMIVEGLDQSRWGVARITPWALTGADAVIAELLAGIAAALPGAEQKTTKLREALQDYGEFVTPLLSVLPIVGTAAKGIAEAGFSKLRNKTVQHHMHTVAIQLREFSRPVLVIVDDIDRLQHAELLALFRGVRVLGRLPYVHYILAYDEQTVVDVLQATEIAHGSRARAFAFLEKIVSLRLDQPPTRAEQAETMLGRGLECLVSESIPRGLTESQQARLDDERETLLSRILTEPRAISRFLMQLRTYLPIIGSAEIDFVDYAVITLLRLAYPQLFQALSHDRSALVRAPTSADDGQLTSWQSAAWLEQFEVDKRHLPRVAGAIHRLFPRTTPGSLTVHLLAADALRKGKRASDPDYVDRYFALTAPTDEPADVVVIETLQEWATGQHNSANDAFGDLLRPPPSDKKACNVAARLIRRASALSEDLDSEPASAVLRTLLRRLPFTSHNVIESATANWIATLLAKSHSGDATEFIQLLDRPREEVSPLPYLLRAIRMVPTPSTTDGEQWLAGLTADAVEAAWNRVTANVALGDNAPLEPISQMIRWLEDTMGPAALRKRIASSIDSGLPLPDFAARMIETAGGVSGVPARLVPLDVNALVLRLGQSRILERREELIEAATSAPTKPGDSNDLSWSNRKAAAAVQLSSAADQRALIRLPQLQIIETPSGLLTHEPDLISSWRSGQDPDLKAQLTVLVPGGSTVPTLTDHDQGLAGDVRERTVLRLLHDTPITTWLSRIGDSWHFVPDDWHITDGQARSSTTATFDVDADASGANTNRRLPIRLSAQVRTGLNQAAADSQTPVLLLTIVVAFWLVELGEDRYPDDIRHDDALPLPAALSLNELVELIADLLTSVAMAFEAADSILPNAPESDSATVDLAFHSTGGLRTAIDLRNIRTIGDPRRPDHRMTFSVDRAATTPDETLLGQAAAIVGEWLLRDGFRDYEPHLLDLVQAHYD